MLLILLAGQLGTFPAAYGQAAAPSAKAGYQDYGFSAFGVNDSISRTLLERSTGGNLSVGNLERYISSELLRYNVRRVLLDVGWQNYSVGQLPDETWVNNWLAACDSLGVGNVLFVGQLAKAGIGSHWVESLIQRDPAVETYSSNGKPAPYLSPDNPDVVVQLEHDLATLYSYYGKHPSWIGLGTGSSSLDPYYDTNSSLPALGYSNTTLAAFARSQYFAADINASGYDPNGVLDSLWAEFRNVKPSILLSSGDWQLSVPVRVFGTVANGNTIAMRFYLPTNQSGIGIEWYGNKMSSSAGDLNAEILSDSGGVPVAGPPLASAIQTSSSLTLSTGWQGPLKFGGTFPRGYYWLHLTSPSTSKSDSYQIYVRNYPVDNLFGLNAGNDTGGHWSSAGQSILWIKSADGTDLALYPYTQPLVVPQPQQSFIAESSFYFNTVYLFLSDRHYDPANGTITIADTSSNNAIDTGVLSQSLMHGLQNWIPISLDHTMTAQKGHKYVMTITEPNAGYSWNVVLRGLTVDPPIGGFQGQEQFWLFRLAMVNWGESHIDFTSDGPPGPDAVSLGHPEAIRFEVPAPRNGTTGLSGLSIFMLGAGSFGTFHSANVSMRISIHSNNQSIGMPANKPLQSLTLPGSSIPSHGWLNVTGFNLQLAYGGTYWVVFSTDTRGVAFPMARLVSPYKFQTLVSLNNGSSWVNPAQGPTDSAFVARFSDGERIGNYIQDVPAVAVDGTSFFAQPFRVSNPTQATGVFIGPIKAKAQVPSNFVMVSINPSEGNGQPSAETLAVGRLYSGNFTLNYGLQFIQFSSAARLETGQEYWIVVRGLGGRFEVDPVVYSVQQSGVDNSMVSRNAGYSWTLYSNLTTTLSFKVAASSTPLTTFSTEQLVSNLAKFHSSNPDVAPTAGWNSFVKSLEIQREANLTMWFRGFSGMRVDFYGSSLPSILTSLHPPHFTPLAYNGTVSTCSSMNAYLLSSYPTQGLQFPVVNDLKLLKSCFPTSSNFLIGQLNYVKFQGPQYGLNTTENVLVLGSKPNDELVPQLQGGYNVAYIDAQSNPETAQGTDKSLYKIIILEGNPKVGAELSASLEGFARHGGTLLNLGPSPAWLGDFAGSCTPTMPTSMRAFQTNLDYWTKNTQYYQKLKVGVSNGYLVASGLNLTVSQSRCGLGRVMVLDQASQNARGQVSGTALVLSNIIANTFSPNSASPFWFDPSSASLPTATYSVLGKANGQILVWVTNPSPTQLQISINLNRTYYGLPSNWKVLDISTLRTFTGRGDIVTVTASVPPKSWSPFCIVPNNSSVRGDYSSIAVETDFRYPNQALATFKGAANQSALMAFTMNSTVRKVTLNDRIALEKISTISNLIGSPQGWFFDTSTNTLFVKWNSDSASSLRVEYVSQPSPIPTSLPETRFLLVFSVVLAVEVVTLIYLRLSNKKPRGKTSRNRSYVVASFHQRIET